MEILYRRIAWSQKQNKIIYSTPNKALNTSSTFLHQIKFSYISDLIFHL